jgi:hypothetical protein
MFLVALMVSAMPCLAACIAHSVPTVPSCHHKRSNETTQSCPHQFFRAVTPAVKLSPVSIVLNFTILDAVSPRVPELIPAEARVAADTSPPSQQLKQFTILRV